MRWTGLLLLRIFLRAAISNIQYGGGRIGEESSPGDKRYLISAACRGPCDCRDAFF